MAPLTSSASVCELSPSDLSSQISPLLCRVADVRGGSGTLSGGGEGEVHGGETAEERAA